MLLKRAADQHYWLRFFNTNGNEKIFKKYRKILQN